MRIHVLYFAFFRERVGLDEEWLDVPEGADINQALDLLCDKYEAIAGMRGKFRSALNQEMVVESTGLHEGDELALIPPVAGGVDDSEGENKAAVRHAKIFSTPLNLERTLAAVSTSGMGGIVTFIGQVRDHNEGHAVLRLEYEAYKDMAVKVMTRLCEEIELEIPGAYLAVEHRVGVLEIGDAAVMIAAAAPHRAQAFEACRALIDRLKESVPIWKKEVAPDGQEWIGLGP
jgi:molybdopterin synthase catalytic subunit